MVAIQEILNKLLSIERMLSNQNNEPPITLEQAVIYTGLSKSFLYKLTSQHKIPYYKPNGKKVYFMKKDLDNYILKNRVSTDCELKQEAINICIKKTYK